jgi:hypothetical protein
MRGRLRVGAMQFVTGPRSWGHGNDYTRKAKNRLNALTFGTKNAKFRRQLRHAAVDRQQQSSAPPRPGLDGYETILTASTEEQPVDF